MFCTMPVSQAIQVPPQTRSFFFDLLYVAYPDSLSNFPSSTPSLNPGCRDSANSRPRGFQRSMELLPSVQGSLKIELELYSTGKRGKPFRHPQTLNTCKGAHECPCNVMTTCEYQGRAPVELAKVQILSLLQFQPKEAAPTPRLIRHGGSPASSAWSQASEIHGMPY